MNTAIILLLLALLGCTAVAFPAIPVDPKTPIDSSKVKFGSDLAQGVESSKNSAALADQSVLAKEKSDQPGENRNARILLVKNVGGIAGAGFGTGFGPGFGPAVVPAAVVPAFRAQTFQSGVGFTGFNGFNSGFNGGFNSGFFGLNGSPLRFWL